jgi:polysaccharide export outer membrane protein
LLAGSNGYSQEAQAAPKASAAQSATQAAPLAQDRSYRIGSGDVLEINVWKEPEASVPSITVRPDGVISMPLIKEVQAVGKTPSELEDLIEERLGKLIRDADVTVVVRETRSEKVYVIGAVRKEGPINLQARLRVLEVIAEAGGLTDYAKRNKIYILRQGPKGQERIPFDYTSVIKGLRTEQNIVIQRGDTIVVP